MQTIWLGDDENDGYITDLVARLFPEGDAGADTTPTDLVAIGLSGLELARRLASAYERGRPAASCTCRFWCVSPDQDGKVLRNAADEGRGVINSGTFAARRVLVVDSAVHSGRTMRRVHDRIAADNPDRLQTYALVIKESSSFVPSFWARTIGHFDRVYFMLGRIPNNRLVASECGAKHTSPAWSLTLLTESDCATPQVVCGVQSLDCVTWWDRHFAMCTSVSGQKTYLLKVCATTAGYLTVHQDSDRWIVVDELAVDESQRKKGFGGVLIRFAETYARAICAPGIRLWAIKQNAEFYERYGYAPTAGPAVRHGDDAFVRMGKPLVGVHR